MFKISFDENVIKKVSQVLLAETVLRFIPRFLLYFHFLFLLYPPIQSCFNK